MRVLDRLAPTLAMRLLVSSGENGLCSPEIVRAKRQKTVKPLNLGDRSMMVHCNYALMVVSRRSTPLGKSDRPIQDE